MVWVGMDLKDNFVPTPCCGQGYLPSDLPPKSFKKISWTASSVLPRAMGTSGKDSCFLLPFSHQQLLSLTAVISTQHCRNGCLWENPHLWKCSRAGGTGLWVTWLRGRCSCPWQGFGTKWTQRSLATQTVLGFYDKWGRWAQKEEMLFVKEKLPGKKGDHKRSSLDEGDFSESHTITNGIPFRKITFALLCPVQEAVSPSTGGTLCLCSPLTNTVFVTNLHHLAIPCISPNLARSLAQLHCSKHLESSRIQTELKIYYLKKELL